MLIRTNSRSLTLAQPGRRAMVRMRCYERAMLLPLGAKGLTLRGMVAELTRRKIATPRGGRWHAETVKSECRSERRRRASSFP